MNIFLFLDTINELCVEEVDESYGRYNIGFLVIFDSLNILNMYLY